MDGRGKTPLHYFAECKNPTKQCIVLLISAIAKVNVVDKVL